MSRLGKDFTFISIHQKVRHGSASVSLPAPLKTYNRLLTMAKQSAGLLMYRQNSGLLEVFLVHPGGPLWAKKDHDAWTIPKGEYAADEPPLDAAQREFVEETGFLVNGPFTELGTVKQASGKIVAAWAFAGECDPAKLVSNTCTIEWPPRSRRKIEIPEIDRGQWFSIAGARPYLREAQHPFLDRLCAALGEDCP
jgi:predicted NUDIX family NTP pyrophosphohydrolase